MNTTKETKVITTCTCGRSSEIVIRPTHGAQPHAPETIYEGAPVKTGVLERIVIWKEYETEDGSERMPVLKFISLPPRQVKENPEGLEETFYSIVGALDSLNIEQLKEVRALIDEINQRPPFD